jgi:hypothetical protein
MVKGIMSTAFAVIAVLGVLAVGDSGVELAQADQCVQQCRSAHNQCRINSKGSPSCDAQLQACMDSCRAKR